MPALHSFDAARQQPNRSCNYASDQGRVSDTLPVSATVFYFQALGETADERDRREEQYREFYKHQNAGDEAGHVSSKAAHNATDPALLKYPLIRPVDVILIGSIVALGMFVMAVALGVI